DAEYTVVESSGERLILAQALLYQSLEGGCGVVGTIVGSDLEGLRYERLYDIPIGYSKGDKPAYRIIAGDFVSIDEGTGIVHIAPAYGEIDFRVGEEEGLPLVHTVNLDGRVKAFPSGFTPQRDKEIREGLEIPIIGPKELPIVPGKDMFVKDADPLILEDLKSRGLLYRSETIRHTYPFCWRCSTPLLYYAKPSWYIKTTAKKERLIAGNEEINWYPEHIKHGRFGDWLENNV
ncbi:MAG: class I tRNA ligase family protein, partial [Dehalococcoidia bacterium]|nr:class I tRNA ligase family protein [Dehalococcoidia bacterium]